MIGMQIATHPFPRKTTILKGLWLWFIIVLILSGCSNNSKSKIITAEDFSLIDTVTGKTISLGMTKGEIATILNDNLVDVDTEFLHYSEVSGLCIGFRDNIAVLFRIHEDTDAVERFKTSRDIQVGASAEDFMEAYPTAYASRINDMYIYALKEDSGYKDISSEFDDMETIEQVKLIENLYVISYGTMNINEKPDTLYMGDYKAIMYGNYSNK